MTPTAVKTAVMKVLQVHAPQLAEAFEPLFVGEKANMEATWEGELTRVLKYDSRCNACGKVIKKGMKAVWIKDKGTWHICCFDGGE